MEKPINIKEYKNALRNRYKERRRVMTQNRKAVADHRIAVRIRSLPSFRRAKTVLVYVSMPIEVDTREIIAKALSDGKRVAVPRCVPGTREMEFYLIDSLEELSPSTFGVLEPLPDPARLLRDFSHSICVVPALACDRGGYRLGYGGGYYDRFLRDYPGEKVLILYKCCFVAHLWHGRFDVPVDRVVTEYFTAGTAVCKQGSPPH
ncbi:MAG: 5-formyltetrahydrofolate cyclo-ligase [Candidatus Fimivivens sp.]